MDLVIIKIAYNNSLLYAATNDAVNGAWDWWRRYGTFFNNCRSFSKTMYDFFRDNGFGDETNRYYSYDNDPDGLPYIKNWWNMKLYQNKKLEIVVAFFFIMFLSLNVLFNPRNIVTNYIFISLIALLLIYIRRLVKIRNNIIRLIYIILWLSLAILAIYYTFVAIWYVI